MKKTILKFIKSPAFDVFIFVVVCLISLLLYILYCIPVYASSSSDIYYNSEGYVTYQTPNFNSERNYSETLGFNPTLIHNSDTSIPPGYVQVAYYIYAGPLYNDIRAVYGDPSSHFEFTTGSSCYISTTDSSTLYMIENRVDSNGNLTFRSNSSNSRCGSGYCRISCLVPVYDSNGNLLSPTEQLYFQINSVYDVNSSNLYFNASTGSTIDTNVDFYLFPSSAPITSGSTTQVIDGTYYSNLSGNDYATLIARGFSKILGVSSVEAQTNEHFYSPAFSFKWLKETSSSRLSSVFNPDVYGLPYAKLTSSRFHDNPETSGSITQTVLLNIPSMDKSRSGVYFYNDLCVVAVTNVDGTYFVSRFDFSRTDLLSGSVVPPAQIHYQSHYIEPSVSDFQAMADYLRYVIQVSDNNRDVELRNQIAYLQSIPWSGYMANGVAAGMANFLPQLSAEFDTMFNGLFTDFFVPDLEDIEAQVDEDEEAFSDKFQWVHDIKAEVNFIVHTPLAADDDEFVFKATIQKYSIGEVIFFDSEWIDGSTRIIVKRVITVFCTIALIVYIFKTLPSTLGNMPSD